MLGTIEKSGLQWSSEEVRCAAGVLQHSLIRHVQHLRSHFTAVAACLDDPELPVRVHAALALTEMVTNHETGASGRSP